MVKALTNAARRRVVVRATQKEMDAAVAYFHETRDRPKPPSLRQICTQFGVKRTTLTARLAGRPSKAESNADRSHFSAAESGVLVDFLIDIASRAFPDTRKRFKNRINVILQAKYGDPAFEIDEQWVDRFLERHSDRVSKYWSTSLETVRANAMNHETAAHYYQLLGTTVTDYNIDSDLEFSMDETNMPFGRGGKACVIGAKGNRVQSTTRDGNRETATMIVCTCADGSVLTPTVIFKGTNFTGEKAYDNPTRAAYVQTTPLFLSHDISASECLNVATRAI